MKKFILIIIGLLICLVPIFFIELNRIMNTTDSESISLFFNAIIVIIVLILFGVYLLGGFNNLKE